MKRFYQAAGGRKVGVGLLAALVLTAMAFPLDADFASYATALLAALGLTQGSVAYEDVRRGRDTRGHHRRRDADE